MSDTTPQTNPFWNVYIPGPTDPNSTAWYQSYLRLGATDSSIENTNTLSALGSSDYSAGILLYTTGKYVQRSQTSNITTYGPSYTATFSGKMIASATYNYSVGSLANQLVMSNQAKFTFNAGVQNQVNFGDTISFNVLNNIAGIGAIKYDPIFGAAMKIAPIDLVASLKTLEFKGGALTAASAAEGKLRGVRGVKLSMNPLDSVPLAMAEKWTMAVTAINGLMAAVTVLWSTALYDQGGFPTYGTQEANVQTQLRSISIQVQILMSLLKVTEAIGLIFAAVIYFMRKADPVGDYLTPEVELSATGIRLKVSPAVYIELGAFGIVMSAPTRDSFFYRDASIPVLMPPASSSL